MYKNCVNCGKEELVDMYISLDDDDFFCEACAQKAKEQEPKASEEECNTIKSYHAGKMYYGKPEKIDWPMLIVKVIVGIFVTLFVLYTIAYIIAEYQQKKHPFGYYGYNMKNCIVVDYDEAI